MKPRIIVLGSSNTDMVIKADHLPEKGETIIGGSFFMNPGGKGANQAVAAARLGGRVTLISKIGTDMMGKASLKIYEEEGINTTFIFTDPDHASGVALITVDRNGDNCIVVSAGANAKLLPDDLHDAVEAINDLSLVLMQLETPLETVEFIAEAASRIGARIILNPAPARPLSNELLSKVSILTPNRKEAEMLSGLKITDIPSAALAAQNIAARGVKTVIITLGQQGIVLAEDNKVEHLPAKKINAVDTTAAGDVFNGALAVALAEGNTIQEAARFAISAAAISVSRMGAQSSAPYKMEVEEFIFEH